MTKVYSQTSNVPDLPDDVVLRVSGISKKFCRNLRRSMWYGIQDLSKNLLGVRDAGYGMRDAGYGMRDAGAGWGADSAGGGVSSAYDRARECVLEWSDPRAQQEGNRCQV